MASLSESELRERDEFSRRLFRPVSDLNDLLKEARRRAIAIDITIHEANELTGQMVIEASVYPAHRTPPSPHKP